MSKQSKWRYIGATEQRLTRWKWGIAGWIVMTVAVFEGQEFTLEQHRQELKALKAQGELQHRLDEVYARTLTLEPQERMQILLRQGGYAVTTPAYVSYAVMDPSCQVHRQQEQGRVVWRGEPRVVTHNGVVSAVVTNESIVALPESEKDETNSVKINHR